MEGRTGGLRPGWLALGRGTGKVVLTTCLGLLWCGQVKEDFTVSEETIGVFISLGTAAVSAAGGVFMEKYLHHAAAVSSSSVAKAGPGVGTHDMASPTHPPTVSSPRGDPASSSITDGPILPA